MSEPTSAPDPRRFLHDGRLESLPRRWRDKVAVTRYLATQALPVLLEPVGERELTDRLGNVAHDPVGFRSTMVRAGPTWARVAHDDREPDRGARAPRPRGLGGRVRDHASRTRRVSRGGRRRTRARPEPGHQDDRRPSCRGRLPLRARPGWADDLLAQAARAAR